MVLKPKAYGDELDFFMEASNERRYEGARDIRGLLLRTGQPHLLCKGVLRRLHFKNPNTEDKLVSV